MELREAVLCHPNHNKPDERKASDPPVQSRLGEGVRCDSDPVTKPVELREAVLRHPNHNEPDERKASNPPVQTRLGRECGVISSQLPNQWSSEMKFYVTPTTTNRKTGTHRTLQFRPAWEEACGVIPPQLPNQWSSERQFYVTQTKTNRERGRHRTQQFRPAWEGSAV